MTLRNVVAITRVACLDGATHWPVGTVGGRLENWPLQPGWVDLPAGDDRHWKVDWDEQAHWRQVA